MKEKLQSIINDLEKLATDLPEVTAPGDAEFQAERLKKIIKRLKDVSDTPSTNIHGSGTGED